MNGHELLQLAMANGLRLRADEGSLLIVGPLRAERVALRLLARKADLLPLLRLPSIDEGCGLHQVAAPRSTEASPATLGYRDAVCACCGVHAAAGLRCRTCDALGADA